MALNGLIIALFEMITIFKLEGRRPSLHFISGGVMLVCVAFLILEYTSGELWNDCGNFHAVLNFWGNTGDAFYECLLDWQNYAKQPGAICCII